MKYFTLHSIEDGKMHVKFNMMDAHTYSDIFHRLMKFPEKKYSPRTNTYILPVTPSNIAYLNEAFSTDEYDTDELSGLEISHLTKTYSLQKLKEKQRLFYVDSEEEPEIKYKYKHKPYKHQIVATNSLHGSEYFALLMEMGTGKTKVVIDEICWVSKGRYVVVCPKNVMGQWVKQLREHMTEEYAVTYMRTGAKGVEGMISMLRREEKIKVFITSFGKLRSMQEYIGKLKPDMTIIDESHCIKNRNAKCTKASWKLGEDSQRRVILTGTPVANTLLDLFAQFQFLKPGSLGYNAYAQYKKQFVRFKKIEKSFEKLVGYQQIDELKRFMSLCSFVAKKKDCLDLPEKVYEIRDIVLQPKQREMYDMMVDIALADLEDDLSVEGTVNATVVIVQILRLSQIANGFVKTMDGEERNIPGGNPKIDELLQYISDVPSHEKVVIWARFHKDVDNIREALKDNYVTLDGRTKDKQRSIDSFNSDYGARYLIGEPGSGGAGIDLLGTEKYPCSNHAYFSNDYSALKRAQSEDRSHRIGMFCPVTYTDFLCLNTIEERIYKILKSKRELNEDITTYSSVRKLLTGE